MIHLVGILFFSFSSFLLAAPFSDLELQAELDQFRADPKLFYGMLPPKKGAVSALANGDSNGHRRQLDQRFIPSSPSNSDLPQNLMEDGDFVSNLQELSNRKLSNGRITDTPWSDDYWPFYKGSVAARYADRGFPMSNDWKQNFTYAMTYGFLEIFSSGSTSKINTLSPAEKYDLVIGAKNGALTSYMWREGEPYYKDRGYVESWLGICHGWAPASYMQQRPKNSVEVLAFDGETKIKFYPADIKALITLLWANARTPVKFVGSRCNSKDPNVDDIGRPIDPDCVDTNPATWHLAITNRVGGSKKSFIMDTTYDYQVWNQPITSYTYMYFNPETLKLAATIESGMISLEDFSRDKFKRYRAPNAKFVIGIKMQTTYAVEHFPLPKEVDTPNDDSRATVSYTYDLELDHAGNIVGGEWYRNAHPDFLWTPTKNAKAMAQNDHLILDEPLWDGQSSLPKSWQEYGEQSAKRGQPLLKIIDSLTALSLEN